MYICVCVCINTKKKWIKCYRRYEMQIVWTALYLFVDTCQVYKMLAHIRSIAHQRIPKYTQQRTTHSGNRSGDGCGGGGGGGGGVGDDDKRQKMKRKMKEKKSECRVSILIDLICISMVAFGSFS